MCRRPTIAFWPFSPPVTLTVSFTPLLHTYAHTAPIYVTATNFFCTLTRKAVVTTTIRLRFSFCL